MTMETKANLERTEACEGLGENSEAQIDCLLQNANTNNARNNELDAYREKKTFGNPKFIGNAVAITSLLATRYFLQDKREPCTATSWKLFKIGVGGTAAADLFDYFAVRKKLSNLEKTYTKSAAESDIKDKQLQAFDYLINEQQILKNSLDRRKFYYAASAAIHAAAATYAVVEAAQGNGYCFGQEAKSPLLTQPILA